MARRTGILSDSHSDKYCLEYNSAPLGYYNAHYQELPPNPNLTGIKTPRYVASVNKPPLDVAAVNLGKLLHQNKQLSADFIMEKMLLNVKDFKPPQITLHPPLGNTSASASITPNVNMPPLGRQLVSYSSGSSSSNGNGNGNGNGSEGTAATPHGLTGYQTPNLSRDPSIAGSSESEDEDRSDPRTSSVRFREQQTGQEAERTQVRAAFEPASATRRQSSRPLTTPLAQRLSDRLGRRFNPLEAIRRAMSAERAQTGDSSSSSVSTPPFEVSAPAPADTDVRRI